jgi:UDP:flavonoid glycosyltransferase YjiC (YdhE family)
MRIVVSAWPAMGHLLPMLPFARAALRAGHDVVVVSGADVVPEIQRRGLAAHPAGPTLEQAYAAATARIGAPIGSLTPEQELAASATYLFGAAAVSRATRLIPFFREWQPDLVVHDVLELGAPAAAEALGLRHATHSYGPTGRNGTRRLHGAMPSGCRPVGQMSRY